MKIPLKKEFWQVACVEVENIKGIDSWNVIDCTDDINVLQTIWAFKIKCFPDGLIKKFKALFCACGDQQLKGIN